MIGCDLVQLLGLTVAALVLGITLGAITFALVLIILKPGEAATR